MDDKKLNQIEAQLLLITRQFLLEQETERAVRAVSLDAMLDRQLGIDSLSKVELFHRIEKAFGVQLSSQEMAQAENLHEIAKAILNAKPAKKFFSQQVIQPILENLEIDLSKITTLLEILIQYAVREPNRPHIFLQDEDGKEEIITYGDLLTKASSIANGLIAKGVLPDDAVAIMLPTSNAFFQSFFGVLLAGAIPVPIYPPFRMDRIEEYILREARILINAEVRVLITFSQAETLSKILQSHIPSLSSVTTAASLLKNKSSLPKISRSAENSALLQYSSGSTGDPKGILLNHNNILANMRAVGEGIQLKPTDCVVSWLPLYHDMGLMSWLYSMYYGLPITILSPMIFLNRPERWLWAIHYHRATLSAGPNFAYELCAKRLNDDDLAGLDLSSWRLAFNGAEAVNPNTLRKFYQKFKKFGLKKEALFPVYGLAENTVGLTFPELNKEFQVDRVSREILERDLRAVPAENNYLEFVCEGKAIPGHEIRIADDEGQVLAERFIGNVQFRGPSAMQGYYHNPKATQAAYINGWWNSGDLGYLADDNLFITGRKKDMIIKAGRNLYPESMEEIVGNIAGIRRGCVIAFGVTDEKLGTEKIIIVAEAKIFDKDSQTKMQEEIIEKMTVGIGVPPDQVILVAPHTIPKTSSGKLQRSACKNSYLKGELGKKPRVIWQMSYLFVDSIAKRAKHFFNTLGKVFYTTYLALLWGISALPTWLFVLILPRSQSAKLIKIWCKICIKLSFCPLHIEGENNLYLKKPMIFVANHASYSDAFLLLSILPAGALFIGKKELLKWPMASSVMRKLNYIAVDRWDLSQNVEDTKLIGQALENQNSILIFPEGTFTYASGLQIFKAGAFQLAVDTGISICPIAIKNSRKLLRAGTCLLSPTAIEVTVCSPLEPENSDWSEVNRLRNESRKLIANFSGEPVIDIIGTNPKSSKKEG